MIMSGNPESIPNLRLKIPYNIFAGRFKNHPAHFFQSLRMVFSNYYSVCFVQDGSSRLSSCPPVPTALSISFNISHMERKYTVLSSSIQVMRPCQLLFCRCWTRMINVPRSPCLFNNSSSLMTFDLPSVWFVCGIPPWNVRLLVSGWGKLIESKNRSISNRSCSIFTIGSGSRQ